MTGAAERMHLLGAGFRDGGRHGGRGGRLRGGGTGKGPDHEQGAQAKKGRGQTDEPKEAHHGLPPSPGRRPVR